jgi:pimeloyl-ACP methyl ester carboxylesterase
MFINPLPERLDVSGTSIEILTKGSGQTLLFLHPAHGLDPADKFIDRLSQHFRVVAPMHPGFGDSPAPEGVTTVDDLVHFDLDLIEQFNLRDAILVGASFGGWVAAELATKGTGRFSRLVLMDTVGAKFGDRESRDILDICTTPIDDLPATLFADPEIGRRALGDLEFPSMSEAAITRFARNRESLVLFGWAPTLYNPKLRQRLHRIDIPTLVLWGEQDRVVSPSYGQSFAQAVNGAVFETVPNAGHYGFMEQPDAYADHVLDFIKRSIKTSVYDSQAL